MLTIQTKHKSLNIDTDIFRLACSRTLKRMGKRIITFSSTAIRERYNVKKKTVDPNFTTKPPSVRNLNVTVVVSGKRLAVEDFGARYPTRWKSQQKVQGVSVEIIRGQRRIIRPIVDGAPMGTFRGVITKSQAVFIRRARGTRRVQEVTTIGVSDMFRSEKISKELDAFVEETLPQELEHQVDFALTQQSGGSADNG